ncbi:hypothetical protein [Nocardioides yefusunii]|uniref:SPW repeat-containing protein n=1 Tax=Nocardioides yefusunii TaxID=2500546 RepID=A0ABW1QY62_9ACTN|nr:hypothetical protein [Nocardioides yefusunii]
MLSTLLRTLVRAVALTLLFLGQIWAWDTFAPSTDANIGAGLLAFLVSAVVAFGWSWRDAVRHGWLNALVCWTLAAVLFDVTVSLANGFDGGGFMAVLTLVPAAVGTLIGGLVRVVRRR